MSYGAPQDPYQTNPNNPYQQSPYQAQQAPYGYPGHYPMQYGPPPQSRGLGIASLVMGIVAGLIAFVCVVMAGIADMQGLGEEDPEMMIAGCGILIALLIALAGLVLGIIGVSQKAGATAIVGVVLSGLVLLGVAGLMLIGLMMPV